MVLARVTESAVDRDFLRSARQMMLCRVHDRCVSLPASFQTKPERGRRLPVRRSFRPSAASQLDRLEGAMTMKRPTDAKSIVARIAAAALLAAALGNGGPASAADINVLSAAAMQSVFKEIAADFQRTSGHRLLI